jgi:hypothetical protein
MPILNIVDLDLVEFDAQARLDQWDADYERLFYAPLIEAELVEALLMAGPEVQAAFAAARPEEFARLAAYIERMRGALEVNNGTR